MDPEIWHPEAGHKADPLAKETCRSCPVRGDCLEYALATRQRLGIWGGFSERQRRRILRLRNGARPAMARAPRPRKQAG